MNNSRLFQGIKSRGERLSRRYTKFGPCRSIVVIRGSEVTNNFPSFQVPIPLFQPQSTAALSFRHLYSHWIFADVTCITSLACTHPQLDLSCLWQVSWKVFRPLVRLTTPLWEWITVTPLESSRAWKIKQDRACCMDLFGCNVLEMGIPP